MEQSKEVALAKEVAVVEQSNIPVIANSFLPIEVLKKRAEQVAELKKALMVRKIDFDIIPGATKPSLFQPGAEKLAQMFMLAASYEILKDTEIWEEGKEFFYYRVKCTLHHKTTDEMWAEGIGICHTKEARVGDALPVDICHSILMMAQKRAFVKAVRTATGSSELFTQDMEDRITRKKEKNQKGALITKIEKTEKWLIGKQIESFKTIADVENEREQLFGTIYLNSANENKLTEYFERLMKIVKEVQDGAVSEDK